jgi:tetratricopeptide (TPR) repeat protein
MEGRSEMAIEAARRVAANVRLEVIEEFPMGEFFHTIPLLALTQFGRWDEILQQPQPAAELDFSNAIWHYVRATAFSRKGNIEAAQEEYAALAPLRESTKVHFLDTVDYPASQLLLIADELAQGEIALAAKKADEAAAHFALAVAAQDELPYTEPPFWYYPTRQSLGEALLLSGDAAGAEAVYLRDLELHPRNGWSMFGLIQSLQAQGKDSAAAVVEEKFEAVWSQADVSLTSSRF